MVVQRNSAISRRISVSSDDRELPVRRVVVRQPATRGTHCTRPAHVCQSDGREAAVAAMAAAIKQSDDRRLRLLFAAGRLFVGGAVFPPRQALRGYQSVHHTHDQSGGRRPVAVCEQSSAACHRVSIGTTRTDRAPDHKTRRAFCRTDGQPPGNDASNLLCTACLALGLTARRAVVCQTDVGDRCERAA